MVIWDGSKGIRSLTWMIGKTVTKLVWIFSKLDFFSKLEPVLLLSLYLKLTNIQKEKKKNS